MNLIDYEITFNSGIYLPSALKAFLSMCIRWIL